MSTLLKAARRFGTPLYVYDAPTLRARCRALTNAFPNFSIHYAVKANANPSLLSIIRAEGLGIETVSPGELRSARKGKFSKSLTSFTCASASADELAFAARAAGVVHLDSLHQLETWGERKLGRDVSLRVNQGVGSGHHRHTITGGPDSKFGITLEDLSAARRIAKKYDLRIVGLQQHIGSGILAPALFMEGVEALLRLVREFPEVTRLDFGGGLGIPYRPRERTWNLDALGARVLRRLRQFEREQGRSFAYSLEPGRYVVAECGTLLVEVTDDKRTKAHRFIGVNSGFNHLVRPAMYGSYHRIDNLSNPRGKKTLVSVAGNVCESGDVFAWDRPVAAPRIGDILAIRDAGAYGMSMASRYNARELPKEILIDGARMHDVKTRR